MLGCCSVLQFHHSIDVRLSVVAAAAVAFPRGTTPCFTEVVATDEVDTHFTGLQIKDFMRVAAAKGIVDRLAKTTWQTMDLLAVTARGSEGQQRK